MRESRISNLLRIRTDSRHFQVNTSRHFSIATRKRHDGSSPSNAILLVPNLSVLSLGKSYFADYFLMGGSKFDSPQPEAYLFGENSDLNLLNPKPVSVRMFQHSSIKIHAK